MSQNADYAPPTQCGFCVDGAFVLRARAGQEQRTIRCPYCDGHGNIIHGLAHNDGPGTHESGF